MQVICPECGRVGLLQTITTRYHRVRHSIVTVHVGRFNGIGRPYKTRGFVYCRVSAKWTQEQIDAEKQRDEEAYRRIVGIK